MNRSVGKTGTGQSDRRTGAGGSNGVVETPAAERDGSAFFAKVPSHPRENLKPAPEAKVPHAPIVSPVRDKGSPSVSQIRFRPFFDRVDNRHNGYIYV